MKRICVVGTGYVGLVTGACFAELGNDVHCLDIDHVKIARLQSGELPIYEPGLEILVRRNMDAGRLRFTTSYAEAVAEADLLFIAVNTPTAADGAGVDMQFAEAVARSLAEHLTHDAVIINKSTMPVGSGDLVLSMVQRHLANSAVSVAVVANPEFLREGTAVQDFLHPDRIVLGSTDRAAAERVAQLYLPLRAPIMLTDLYTAEMIKYASNAFLATKISFINEMARICDQLGANVREVAKGMGYDRRIGPAFLEAGLGYGGSCLGKDVKALAHMATGCGMHPQLLETVMQINASQRRIAVGLLETALGGPGCLQGTRIALLGLAFKGNTDDMRDAPSLDIISWLVKAGVAEVRAFDPQAREAAARLLPAKWPVAYCTDEYDAAAGCEGLLIVTDWKRFREISPIRLRSAMRAERAVVVDGRNLLDSAELRRAGFHYVGVGQGARRRAAVRSDGRVHSGTIGVSTGTPVSLPALASLSSAAALTDMPPAETVAS